MKRVRVEELVDLAQLGRGGRPPTPSELRAALPLGWVLDDDGQHAIRDRRVFFGHSWVLLCGLVMFGAAAVGLWRRRQARAVRAASATAARPTPWLAIVAIAMLSLLALGCIGGLVGPLVTRTLNRR